MVQLITTKQQLRRFSQWAEMNNLKDDDTIVITIGGERTTEIALSCPDKNVIKRMTELSEGNEIPDDYRMD